MALVPHAVAGGVLAAAVLLGAGSAAGADVRRDCLDGGLLPPAAQSLGLKGADLKDVRPDTVILLCRDALKAQPDDTAVQVALGRALLAAGRGEDAQVLLRRAAEAGDPWAQYSLGTMHIFGEGIEANPQAGIPFLKQAVEQGNAMAQGVLAYAYGAGLGVPRDDAEAVRLLRLSADQGVAWSQHNLGLHAKDGVGMPKDEAEAARWFRKAAEQGHGEAFDQLAFAYAEGRGVRKDPKEALAWTRKGAEAGTLYGQWRLGVHHAASTDRREVEQGVDWLKKAVAGGEKRAQADLDRARARLADLAGGEARRKDFLAWIDGEIAKEEKALAEQCAALRKMCGGRICSHSKEHGLVTRTVDGTAWYLEDGRMAPKDLWGKGDCP